LASIDKIDYISLPDWHRAAASARPPPCNTAKHSASLLLEVENDLSHLPNKAANERSLAPKQNPE
jgi:hypothetical protein